MPALSPIKLMVAVALTQKFSTFPVSALRPDGISRERTGKLLALI